MKENQGQITGSIKLIRTMAVTCMFAIILLACKQSQKSENATTSSGNSLKFKSLSVPLHGQQTGMWCWAASTQMILGYFDTTVDQCALANLQFKKYICCSDTGTKKSICPYSDCVHGGHLMVDSYGFTCETNSGALSWDVICKQIDSLKAPMCYTIHSPVGDTVKGLYVQAGGHLRVIKGYFSVNGNKYLIINDPMPVCQGSVYPITYDEYAHGRGNWIQTSTTYNISKK